VTCCWSTEFDPIHAGRFRTGCSSFSQVPCVYRFRHPGIGCEGILPKLRHLWRSDHHLLGDARFQVRGGERLRLTAAHGAAKKTLLRAACVPDSCPFPGRGSERPAGRVPGIVVWGTVSTVPLGQSFGSGGKDWQSLGHCGPFTEDKGFEALGLSGEIFDEICCG
jgi:hypothetical protein